MLSVLALAVLAALYTMMRAAETLARPRPPGFAGEAVRVLAVLLLLAGVATFWAVVLDAFTLRQVAEAFRGLFAPPPAG